MSDQQSELHVDGLAVWVEVDGVEVEMHPQVDSTALQIADAAREVYDRRGDVRLLVVHGTSDSMLAVALNRVMAMAEVKVPRSYERDQEQTATLLVSGSYTTCSNCQRQTLPDVVEFIDGEPSPREPRTHHDLVSGYGSSEPGCGARFVAVMPAGPFDSVPDSFRPDLPHGPYVASTAHSKPLGTPSASPATEPAVSALTAGDLGAKHIGSQIRVTDESLRVTGYLENLSAGPGQVGELGSYVPPADEVSLELVRPLTAGSATFQVPLTATVEILK